MTTKRAEDALTDAEAASLALLRHIGGKGYVGPADDPRRNTIAKASADAFEKLGLVAFQHRPKHVVVVLLEIRSHA